MCSVSNFPRQPPPPTTVLCFLCATILQNEIRSTVAVVNRVFDLHLEDGIPF